MKKKTLPVLTSSTRRDFSSGERKGRKAQTSSVTCVNILWGLVKIRNICLWTFCQGWSRLEILFLDILWGSVKWQELQNWNLVTPEEVSFESCHLVILLLHHHAKGAPGAGQGRHLDCLLLRLFVCLSARFCLLHHSTVSSSHTLPAFLFVYFYLVLIYSEHLWVKNLSGGLLSRNWSEFWKNTFK